MADTRQQIKQFIRTLITDPYNQQNSADRVRSVLEYMTDNLSNPADDDIGGGIRWINQPESGTPVVSDGLVSIPFSSGRGYFSGATVEFEPYTQNGIVLAGDGLQRLDAVVALASGFYEYVPGFDAANPVSPAIPDGSLLVASILVNDGSVDVDVPDNGISVVNTVEKDNLNAVSSNAVAGVLDFSTYTTSTTPSDDAVFALQKTDKSKLKLTASGLIAWLKGFFDGSFKSYNPTRTYAVGDRFRGAGAIYEVVTPWVANTYTSDWQIPGANLKLISNLDTPGRVINVGAALSTTGSGFMATESNVTFVFANNAEAGQSVAIYTMNDMFYPGDILQGKTAKVRLVWNGITTISADTTRILGDGSVPAGAVSGDVIVWELLCITAGKFTIVQKYVEGKTLATGGGTSVAPPVTGEAASTVLNFTNQSGHSRLPLTQTGALNFTLGAGTHKPFSVVRQPVISDGVNPITFSSAFDADFLYIGLSETDTLPAGRYEFIFAYNEDGKVSVSVPGSGVDGETITIEGSAVLESSAALLTFSNPFGHIRDTALTGAQTFTKADNTIGSTVVQPYTATGTGAITLNFSHKILNSTFASGTALPAGEYELYFSNRGSYVAVSIALVGNITAEPEEVPAVAGVTAVSNNYNELTVTWQ